KVETALDNGDETEARRLISVGTSYDPILHLEFHTPRAKALAVRVAQAEQERQKSQWKYDLRRLLAEIKSPDEEKRADAATFLGFHREAVGEIVPILIDITATEPDSKAGQNARKSLEYLKDSAVPHLKDIASRADDEKKRHQAIAILDKIGRHAAKVEE